MARQTVTTASAEKLAVSKRIKQLRHLLGDEQGIPKLSQERLAKMAGVSKNAVSQWERGISLPQRDALDSLAKHGINPRWIMHKEGEWHIKRGAHPMPEPMHLSTDEVDLINNFRVLPKDHRSALLVLVRPNRENHAQPLPVTVKPTKTDTYTRTRSKTSG